MKIKDFEYSQTPAPNDYNKRGFAEEAYEKAVKFNSVVNDPSSIIRYMKKSVNEKIEEIKETNNENDFWYYKKNL